MENIMKKVIPVNIDIKILQKIDNFMYENHLNSRSAFVSEAVNKYFEEIEKKVEK